MVLIFYSPFDSPNRNGTTLALESLLGIGMETNHQFQAYLLKNIKLYRAVHFQNVTNREWFRQRAGRLEAARGVPPY